MRNDIIERLSQPTPEEQLILSGQLLNRENYSFAGSFMADSRKLLKDETLITIRQHTRFTDFPMHTHNYVEIMYMLQGSTRHTMGGGEVINLQTGELLLFNRHASHRIDRAEQNDIGVNFIVQPQFFDVALDMIQSDNLIVQFLVDGLRYGDYNVAYLHFCVSEIPPIQSILESMVYSLLAPQMTTQRINQTTMGLLFMYLLRHINLVADSGKQKKPHILVVDALAEIENNYQQADFSALAKRRGVSLAYLSRLVRETTGESCTDLLQKKRICKAEQLLKTTDLSVREISEAVGYSNSSYFYRLFKRVSGSSPREVRDGSDATKIPSSKIQLS